MNGVVFKEANTTFGRPRDLSEEQCLPMAAHRGTIQSGSLEGAAIIVTCWRPSPDDVSRILSGAPIFVGFLGTGLQPHVLGTSFRDVVNPA